MNKLPKFTTIFIIIISIVIIVSCAYFKSLKEGLTNNNYLVLMGDSVLNNANYVSSGKSVFDILKTKTTNILNVAKDGAVINDLYNQLEQIGRSVSGGNVKRLVQILRNNTELDPIILNNGKFFDGGHRLTAYKKLKKELIPTIDIGFMLNFDWEKWDNGEIELN